MIKKNAVLISVCAVILFLFPGVFGVHAASAVETEQQQTSTSTNLGLYGGAVWDMAIDSTNHVLYAVANNTPNGFFYSTDAGATWTGMPTGSNYGVPSAVTVDQTTGDVYLETNGALYKSTDHGVTLTQIASTYNRHLVFANGVLYATADGDSVSVSTDQGASFTSYTVATGLTLWNVAYSEANDEMYALGEIASTPLLYMSADHGQTWTLVHTFDTYSDMMHSEKVAVNPVDPTNIIIAKGLTNDSQQSTDSGDTWSEVTGIRAINASFDSSGRGYLGANYSDDTGTSWHALPSQDFLFGGHLLVADPSNSDTLYADGAVGVLQSVNRGETWTYINQGITGVVVSDISQTASKDVVWIATANGYAKSADFSSGAPTWQFPMLNQTGVSVWVDPSDANIVLAGGICYLYKSIDGGNTWSDNLVAGVVDCTKKVADIVSDPTDSSIVYAAVGNNDPNSSKNGAVLKSTDHGDSWSDISITDSVSVQTLAVSQTGVLYAGIGATGGTGESAKGIDVYSGGTWTQLSAAPVEEIRQLVIDPSDDATMYALAGQYNTMNDGGYGIYKTTDSGLSWTNMTSGLSVNSFDTFTMQDAHTLYLGATNTSGDAVLYKSDDAGATWGLYYTGLHGETFHTLLFDSLTAGNDRGLYALQSKPNLTLKTSAGASASVHVQVGSTISLVAQLKDSATQSVLKNQQVQIYRMLKGGHWKLWKSGTTNKKGKVRVNAVIKHLTKFKVLWTPSTAKAAEYIAGLSRIVTVHVQ